MKKQLYLLLLSSCIFIVIITLLQVNENSKRASYRSSDCFTYEQAAQYLYDEGFKPHPLRPMLYPLIVGIPKLFTTNYEVFLNFNYVLNVTFWLFTILFIYKSIHLLLKPKATLILTLLFVVNISNISLNFQLLTEPIYTFLLSLVMFLVAKFFISRNINHLTSAVGLLVLSILIRPTGLYLAALVVLIFMFFLLKYKYYNQLIVLSIICLCPLFQMVKMSQNKMNFTVSNIGTQTRYYFLCSYAEGVKMTNYDYFNYENLTRAYAQVRAERASLEDRNNPFYWENMNVASERDWHHQLKSNLKGLTFSYIRNIVSNSTAYSFFIQRLENVNKKAYFPFIVRLSIHLTRIQNCVYALSFILTPFFLLYFRKRIKDKQLLYLQITILTIAIYTILVSGISFGQGDRFNIVLVPLALLNFALIYRLLLRD